MSKTQLSRRRFIGKGAAGISSVAFGGCDQFDFVANRDSAVREFLEKLIL